MLDKYYFLYINVIIRLLSEIKKTVKNKIYHKTTFGTADIINAVSKSPNKKTTEPSPSIMNAKDLNPVVYLLIVIFFGMLGIHKFIDGSVGMGVLYLLTCGLCGIGWIVDIVKAILLLIKSNSIKNEKGE